MFFILSKLFWMAVAPSYLLVWLVLATAACLFLGRVHTARWFAAGAAICLILFGVCPMGTLLLRPIENMYPRPATPVQVDGILVLGGGNDPVVLQSRGVMAPDRALARLVTAYELARRYPSARVVFSGGSGLLTNQRISESDAARQILLEMGLPPERLTIEGKSRNTWENFVFTKQIVKPLPGETWLLATSAFHMPRSVAIAQRVGWPMLPWPTDYRTPSRDAPTILEITANLERADIAIHEYIGLLVYRWSGKSA